MWVPVDWNAEFKGCKYDYSQPFVKSTKFPQCTVKL